MVEEILAKENKELFLGQVILGGRKWQRFYHEDYFSGQEMYWSENFRLIGLEFYSWERMKLQLG